MTEIATPQGSDARRHSPRDLEAYQLAAEALDASTLSPFEKLEAFPRFASKRSLARFLVKHELFRRVLPVNGVVVECGVFNGAGLFTWMQLANIYEPTNYNRRVVGFDTFQGFPSVSERDASARVGDLCGEPLEALERSVEKANAERHLAHIPNVELVQGDFGVTGPAYLMRNPHVLVSLLYLDFDLYEPTRMALETFLPRMPKGALVAFDELNCPTWPGETQALLDCLDLRAHRLERSPIDPWISWIEL
jgi:hypothetical protein